MRRFLNLLRQDITIAWRNGFFLVVLVMAALFIGVINFAIPAEVKVGAQEYVVDATEDKVFSQEIAKSVDSKWILETEAELLEIMRDNNLALGVVYKGNKENPQAVIYQQGHEPPKAIKALEAAIQGSFQEEAGVAPPVVVNKVLLRPQSQKPAFNLTMLPILMIVEVGFLGFAFIAVLVFQEKEEGSIRAYRVSPSGTWLYIAAKVVTNLLLAVIYALLLMLFTMGLGVNYPALMLIVILTSLLFTLLGLLVSVFFNGLSDFIFVYILIASVLGLPIAAYFMPAFRSPLFSFIPSYPIMFGMREIIFPTGRTGFLQPMVLTLTAEVLVTSVLARWAVQRKLMKEGH